MASIPSPTPTAPRHGSISLRIQFGGANTFATVLLGTFPIWLWARCVRVFASDTLNPDSTLTEHGEVARTLPVHGFVLGNDGIIVENLRNLRAMPNDRSVFASLLPLSIAKADGSPIRAAVRR